MVFRLALAALALLLAGLPLQAGGYGGYYGSCYYPSYNYCYSYYPTYSYNSGYCYYQSEYTSTRFWPAGYYRWDGCNWYLSGYNGPFYGYPLQQQVATAPAYQAPTLPAYSPGSWKESMVRAQENIADHTAYLQAFATLGAKIPNLPAVSPLAGAYLGPGFPAYNPSANLGYFGAQGNTLYGYSQNTLLQQQQGYAQPSLAVRYSDLDRQAILQTMWRSGDHIQDATSQFYGQAAAVTQNELDANARTAEIRARAAAFATGYRATEPPPVSTMQQSTTTVAPAAPSAPPPQPVQPPAGFQGQEQLGQPQAQADPSIEEARQWLVRVGMPQCGSCHGPKGASAGVFNILAYPGFSEQDKSKVQAWMRAEKPDSRCNGNKSGAFSAEQRAAFFALR